MGTRAESTSRTDDAAWPGVEKAMKAGATLKLVGRARRAWPDYGTGPVGTGISISRLRRLEVDGTIQNLGGDRFTLAIGGGLK